MTLDSQDSSRAWSQHSSSSSVSQRMCRSARQQDALQGMMSQLVVQVELQVSRVQFCFGPTRLG